LRERGNPGIRITVDGKHESPNGEDIDENIENNLETALENLDPENTLPENIGLLESEGYLLPVPVEEME